MAKKGFVLVEFERSDGTRVAVNDRGVALVKTLGLNEWRKIGRLKKGVTIEEVRRRYLEKGWREVAPRVSHWAESARKYRERYIARCAECHETRAIEDRDRGLCWPCYDRFLARQEELYRQLEADN